MNVTKHLATAIFMLAILSGGRVQADVAPPDGYTRVHVKVILETADDLSGYRFFLASGDLVKELTVEKGSPTTVEALGGGARYSAGTVMAIPSTSLEAYGSDPVNERLETMKSDIAKGSLAGAIKLIEHKFARVVSDAEARGIGDETFTINRIADGLRAVRTGADARSGGDSPTAGTTANTSILPPRFSLVTGGALLSLAIVTFGIFMFYRTRRRTV